MTTVTTGPGVKASLTRRGRRDVVENDAYAAFTRRVVAGFARRVGAGDVEALRDLVALSTVLDEAMSSAVAGLRGFGYSWADIASRLGVSRQSVQQRWGGAS